MHILNGSLWETQTTVEDCIEECVLRSPGCLGVDFVHETNECFGHFSETECNLLLVLANVTHYRLTTLCGQYIRDWVNTNMNIISEEITLFKCMSLSR